jgi:para-nitrobenzyl esterase
MLCRTFALPRTSLCLTITFLFAQAARAEAKENAPPDSLKSADRPQTMRVLKVGAEPLRIETGLVRGLIVGPADDVQLYRGIPYAAPPVGDLRWRPPQPARDWQGVRECYAFGAAAPQKPVPLLGMFPGMALGAATSEDCLYLNVWAPTRRSDQPLPVMVWIHGGGYTFGAASQALYDGTNLARRGVVVVAMNYRLGPFGFLAHPQLSAESGHSASGNYGLLDQIEALRWVKRNIAAFGGDPQRVTIFGESAGGNSVYSLLFSPLAKGLFQRAISESGGSLDFLLLKQSPSGFRSAEKMGVEFGKKCGAPQGPGQLAALRAMSADDLLKASSGFETPRSLEFRGDRMRFAPIVDGWVIPDDPMILLNRGQANAVPLIVGANADEGSLFTLRTALPKRSEEFRAALERGFGPEAADRLRELYPATDLRRAVNDLMGDYLFVAPARAVSRAVALQHAKTPVYLYHFAHPTPGAMGKLLGAHHGAEIAYVLDNLQLARSHSSVDEQIRDTLVSYWIQFAATGNPNRAGLPNWPAYDPAGDRCLLVQEAITTAQNLRKARLDAIDGLRDAGRSDGGLTKRPPPAVAQPKRVAAARPAAITPNNQSRKPAALTRQPATPAGPPKRRAEVIKTTGASPRAAVPGPLRHAPQSVPTKPLKKLDVAVTKKTDRAPNAVSKKPPVTVSRPAPPQAKPRAETVKLAGATTTNRPERGAADRRLPIQPAPTGSPTQVARNAVPSVRNEIQSELHHARFLIKAGLSPLAADSLRKIIKEAPGTPAAREAQQSLDSIPKAK